ncbi:hypothetical protein [Hymenobacter terrestris]|uniref:STAS/SEC14 domain-containing protein n=1 Tax=Hymenobacter terrestris TaxID=2748310 RepID=A0ABX2Q0I4_9BACT|nr:hypothetical protein [Hymenobacter terrestris]NVO84453.1 hypothetical protein [Hymenobacter terrestris]
MRQQFQTSTGTTFLLTEFDQQNNWIYNDWRGLLTLESIQEGSGGILQIMQRTRCPYILTDNRLLLGSWKHANDWLEQIWIPQALAAGMTYYAHVKAPGVFGQAAVEDMHLRVGSHLHLQLFEQMEEAVAWLREMQEIERGV